MWRTILLGKLAVSILASVFVGGYCIQHARTENFDMVESLQWWAIGIFFLLLAVVQVGVVVLLNRKPKRSKAT